MNEYDELLGKLSTAEIFKKWKEHHARENQPMPQDWFAAVERHLSARNLTPRQAKTYAQLQLCEEQIKLMIVEGTRQSGRAKLSGKTLLQTLRLHKLTEGVRTLFDGAMDKADELLNSGDKSVVVEPQERALAEEELRQKEKEQLKNLAGDRDQLIVEHVLKKEESERALEMEHASSHLGKAGLVKYHDYTQPVALRDFNEGKERIVLAMCPSWGVIFPPYGLAKMTGMLRKEGFACKVYDLNVQAFHYLLNKLGIDYWRGEKYFYWQDPWFYDKYMAKEINPFLTKGIDAIVADKPTMVGFSLYSTNMPASLFMIKELRRRLPNLVIVAGGPAVAISTEELQRDFAPYVNYFFKGEAEEIFLDFLKKGEHLNPLPTPGITTGSLTSKIALDEKAFADYSDYDIACYTHKDGASIETSRGCVAQCSFCTETYFWKFRSMTPQRVVDEMKYQIDSYGFKRFWFVDSLVNGDLKNFTQLVDLIIENKLNIGWNSYSRCDGRMTKEFIERIAESGCTGLSYGVESGSQKVLNDMRKKIEIWEIYNNLRDTYSTGKIWTHVNWLIGFPTEENIDFYHSNILIFNVRRYIHHLSPGMGCGISELTDLHTRAKLYGIPWENKAWEVTFLGNWFTENFKNTLLNRFIRIKLFHIWMEILQKHAGSVVQNAQRHEDIEDSYWFYSANRAAENVIEADEFVDFNQLKEGNSISFFNANTANDYLAFCYGLYEVFGGFKLRVIFNPKKDMMSWGYLACNYKAELNFEVNDKGNYSCSISHRFTHRGQTMDKLKEYVYERGKLGDMSFKGDFNLRGNLNDWKSADNMVKETIHEVYRIKTRKKIAAG